MITCAEVDELLAAFALDALDDDERAEVEAHLATCDAHEHLAEMQAVALAFPGLTTPVEPPAALEDRIMASITTADPARGSPAPAAPTPAAPAPARSAGGTAPGWRWAAAIAAALAIIVAGAGMLALAFQDDGSTAIVHVYRDGDAWFRAEGSGGESVAVVMDGLAQLPDSQAYQLWAARDGEWHSVGVCNTDDEGWWHGDFDFALQPHDRLVLTIEPAPGSSSPTGQVILGQPPN
jgi:anti-sigma-K factor RskA